MELGTVLAGHYAPRMPRAGNVMEEALERGWIIPFEPGQYIYTRPWAELFRTLQEMIRSQAVQSLGFEEWIFPRIIPRRALDSFKLTQFAPELLVRADPAGEEFLDPVQCISLYHSLRGAALSAERLPLKVVECLGGWTWRNETPERLDGPYRAREFARVEHVYVGTPEQVRETRRVVQGALTSLLTRIGLSWHVVVGNGCMEIPALLSALHEAVASDDVPVQDIEIPIRGALKDDGRRAPDFERQSHYVLTAEGLQPKGNEGLYSDADEICGCSVEGDHLTKDFDIRDGEGQILWSGCCGIGLNRLIVGFLYQHGFGRSNWPDAVASLPGVRD